MSSIIITTGDLTTYMSPKTLDSGIAGQVVSAVNTFIQERTKRWWGATNTITERYDWGRTLWLRQMDIVSITNIKVGWPGQTQSTLPATGYFFNSYGRVTMFWQALSQPTDSALYNDYIEITYVYGNAVVPDDLKLAALGIAAGFYNYAVNEQKDISSASVGSYKVEYGSKRAIPQRKPETITAEANWTIVDHYMIRRV